ncbi:ATP-binding protein [Candidatus Woesearchaeota archaeon]|nr:ATP-binding protein [Candidatus Woesearchaeota archaeon]
MDSHEQIQRAKDFLDTFYEKKIHNLISQGITTLVVDFADLVKHDPEMADYLLEHPEDVIRGFELALEGYEIDECRVRFKNLRENQHIAIRNIRSANINRLMYIEGIVRQSSDVRPQVTSAKFECPSCGNTISILQLETRFKEPSRCTCGRRGKFRLISKNLVDAQRLVLEEAPEALEGGEQPKRLSVFLKEDLVEPKMERKTTPGTKVRVYGIVKEVPIMLRTGAQSIRYDLMMDSNFIEPIDETYQDIEIDPEEEKQIKELSKDERVYEKFIQSIAPSIFGHDDVKEAIVIQLMGGVRKKKEDGTVTRGDMHILLCGDPGCIAGNSQVALIYKGMEKIQNLGQKHLQPIKEAVTKIRKNSKDKYYDYATLFQHYPCQPVLKIITETGKEVICTFNQPFLTKKGWARADEITLGTKIRVMPKIPNMTKSLAPTEFKKVEKTYGKLKDVAIPEKFTPELASLCGYIIGDGNIHPKGYRVTCYINEEEKDILEPLSMFCKESFNINPSIFTRTNNKVKTIDDGNGLLRKFISKQNMHILELNSKQIAHSLSFLSSKRVPQQIFRSPINVVSKFVSWLFEADGCTFGKGRGRTAIQLKSKTSDLLKDVQLLLLYFGIHSRIVGDNLCIRRSHDMEKFAKYIGFNSEKKKKALLNTLDVIKNKDEMSKRKKFQRWEKIIDIVPSGVMDVYDFEVPISKRFIANGIVCHNSGKSQILSFVAKIAPKARFVSGKGASSAGLTAAVVKDEFLKGWALEAGAMVLANDGYCMIDELDKMSVEDTSALHEAMEQQRISISKANIQATLTTRTTVLAAANPKLGRFDPYAPIASQINLPPALINRFDLIFPIRDIPNREKDRLIASHVLKLQQKPSELKSEIETELFRKYLTYAKRKIEPVLTDAAIDEILDFYINLRNTNTSGSEQEIKPIPISARQLEALVRLSEGSARVRLSKKVTRVDAKRAIRLLRHCLMQVGIDPETGQFDIDRMSTGISSSQRSRIVVIREIISELDKKLGKNIPIEEIIAEAAEKGIDESHVQESIEKLKREGEIFEPKVGVIGKM